MLRSIGRRIAGNIIPRKIAYPILTGPLQGYRFLLGAAAGQGGGASVYFNMIEPEQTRTFLTILKPGMCFLDIGANVGYYSLLASKMVGEHGLIICVEPSLRNCFYLNRHLKLNEINNAIILPVACSTDVAIKSFDFGDNIATGHLSHVNNIGILTRKNLTWVPVFSVNEICQSLEITPNLLKIDVEGAEYEVLKGAIDILNKYSPMILLSIHSDSLRISCLNFLRNLNYHVSSLNNSMDLATEYYAYRD